MDVNKIKMDSKAHEGKDIKVRDFICTSTSRAEICDGWVHACISVLGCICVSMCASSSVCTLCCMGQ